MLMLMLAVGCNAASSDPGLRADLRVAGAQFVPGALPAGGTGPMVTGLHLGSQQLVVGGEAQALLGMLAPNATAAAIGLDHDRGYFIALAGVPDNDAPTLPTLDVTITLSPTATLGARQLSVLAVDAAGRIGPRSALPITVASLPLPSGTLVVHLDWDTHADLDLHLVDPTGVEIWSGHPSGYQPPPPPALPDPTAGANAARLDADSNADCVIDGRDQENIIYTQPPPSGHYLVRVDAFSLCGQPWADWHLGVLAAGKTLARASGTAYDDDTRPPHGVGAGATVLAFDLP
jgi:hypothetical protein